MAPAVSLIIASHNGGTTLPRVFAALETCTPPQGDAEYILVNNASTDDTSAIMQAFLTGRQGLVLSELQPGKSFALNAGMRAAKGDLIAFLDDDALPDPHWFTAYQTALRNFPEAGVFVGQVRPAFERDPPAWLADLSARGMSCACTPSSLTRGHCDPGYTKGLNWAATRAAFGDELFDEENNNLVSGSKPVGGQDTEMARRLVKRGFDCVFVDGGLALHIVRPHEMTLQGVFDRYRRIGRGLAAQGDKSSIGRFRLIGEIGILAFLSALCWLAGARPARTIFPKARTWMAANLIRLASRIGRLEMLVRAA